MSKDFGPVYGLKFFLPNKRILNFGREDADLITVSYGNLELIDYFSPSGFSIVRFLSILDTDCRFFCQFQSDFYREEYNQESCRESEPEVSVLCKHFSVLRILKS